MASTRRRSLFAFLTSLRWNLLGWFFLNLAVIGGVLFFFLRTEFGLALGSLLGGSTGHHLQAIAQPLAAELRQQPTSQWGATLARVAGPHLQNGRVRAALVDDQANVVAGELPPLPANVRQSLVRAPAPRRDRPAKSLERAAGYVRRVSGRQRQPAFVLGRRLSPERQPVGARQPAALRRAGVRLGNVARRRVVLRLHAVAAARRWSIAALGRTVDSFHAPAHGRTDRHDSRRRGHRRGTIPIAARQQSFGRTRTPRPRARAHGRASGRLRDRAEAFPGRHRTRTPFAARASGSRSVHP